MLSGSGDTDAITQEPDEDSEISIKETKDGDQLTDVVEDGEDETTVAEATEEETTAEDEEDSKVEGLFK